MKHTTLFAVLAVFMLALVGSVSAAVTVPMQGNIQQTVSISSTGTVPTLSLPMGVSTNADVNVTLTNNVNAKLTIVDAMGDGKESTHLPGHMAYYHAGAFNPLSSCVHIDAKTQFAWNGNPFVVTSDTATDLAGSAGSPIIPGVQTRNLTIKNTVGLPVGTMAGGHDLVIPGVGDYYRLVVNIDAVPL